MCCRSWYNYIKYTAKIATSRFALLYTLVGHGVNMGPISGRQDPGGPHVSPMNFVIWVYMVDSVPWFDYCS